MFIVAHALSSVFFKILKINKNELFKHLQVAAVCNAAVNVSLVTATGFKHLQVAAAVCNGAVNVSLVTATGFKYLQIR
jgi:hypothetical protein